MIEIIGASMFIGLWVAAGTAMVVSFKDD